MIRKFILSITGVLLLAASFFISVASAADYPSFGPQPFDINKYYYFGNTIYPAESRQGLSIQLDPTSVSYQSIKATVTLDYNLIMDRQITMFHVLANGVLVDSFEPYFDTDLSPPLYREFYYIDINVSDQYIGSDNYFQVVGVKEGKHFDGSNNDYVVAWSELTETIHFKDLPTTDADTHTLLQAILDMLQDLKNSLEGKLDQLKQAIENIYEIKPETQQRFDNASAALQAKLPSQQISNEMQTVSNLMDQSKSIIDNGPKDLQFAKVNMYGMEFYFIDFTEVRDQVDKIRNLMKLILWCEFFIFVIRLLVPKLTA